MLIWSVQVPYFHVVGGLIIADDFTPFVDWLMMRCSVRIIRASLAVTCSIVGLIMTGFRSQRARSSAGAHEFTTIIMRETASLTALQKGASVKSCLELSTKPVSVDLILLCFSFLGLVFSQKSPPQSQSSFGASLIKSPPPLLWRLPKLVFCFWVGAMFQ